jgi:hypothetical protein
MRDCSRGDNEFTRSNGGTEKTEAHADGFDGSACAAGRLTRLGRTAKKNTSHDDHVFFFTVRSSRVRRFATPVEPQQGVTLSFRSSPFLRSSV